MLKRLYIKNFAIVDELEVNFEPGFQVITGETGAGKSIMVGALGLLCGERGQSDLVRAGETKAILEAEFTFNTNKLNRILEENGIDFENGFMIIRREISPNGMSRGFINDSPVNITTLSRISDYLVDLHGQHQHQRLLNTESHISYLDEFGRLKSELELYYNIYTAYNAKIQELQDLINQHRSVQEKKDLLNFQIEEIRKANLKNNESEELEKERLKLENSEVLYNTTNQLNEILYSGDESILKTLSAAVSSLKHISNLDKDFSPLLENLESARVTVQEVGRFCEEYGSLLEFDPQRLEEIRTREAQIEWLKKKYQVTSVENLINLRKKLEEQIQRVHNYDSRIQQIKVESESIRKELEQAALFLSQKRMDVAENFEKEMGTLLKSVGLVKSEFKINILQQADEKGIITKDGISLIANEKGMDQIEFYVGLNIGEPVRPLHKVASGGEVSRIMLCIKALLADADEIETLVFDEIDSGISGRYAQIVGQKLGDISDNHQLIVITHLPQIAAMGQVHFAVRKKEASGRTRVEVKKLTTEERITDIAGLLGGAHITQTVRESARELLAESKNYSAKVVEERI
jgi:DNA repair protein RecN (Recombination protein N)